MKGILATIKDCNPSTEQMERVDKMLEELGLHVVKSICHEFPNETITYVCVLKESHFALHCYPEHDSIFIDLFHCNSNVEDERLINFVNDLSCYLDGTLYSYEVIKR